MYLLSYLIKIFSFLTWKLSGGKRRKTKGIVHIVEGADWVIKRIGGYISRGARIRNLDFRIDTSPKFFVNWLIHFGSLHTFAGSIDNFVHSFNRIIVTIFHGNFGISAEMDNSINKLIDSVDRVNRIIAANSIMRNRLISWGIPEEKIAFIPIGVEAKLFVPFPEDKRKKLRNSFGIPEDAICIGSFQKDGNGWNEGLEPKLLKGPDIFIAVVKRLSQRLKIHCLLTGPARGYIKKNLDIAGIPYTYRFVNNYAKMPDFYNCLDLYLVSSREEGGPEAIMESMASGVPLVSTSVGMAPDLIRHGENGFLAGVDDIDSLVRCVEEIIHDNDLKNVLIKNGLETVKDYDWDIIAGKYVSLYKEVLSE